jgi:hypothetical protein
MEVPVNERARRLIGSFVREFYDEFIPALESGDKIRRKISSGKLYQDSRFYDGLQHESREVPDDVNQRYHIAIMNLSLISQMNGESTSDDLKRWISETKESVAYIEMRMRDEKVYENARNRAKKTIHKS